MVVGRQSITTAKRPLSTAKFNYPQAAVRGPDGSIYVANSLGGSVDIVLGDSIETLLGAIENTNGRINRYGDLVLEDDQTLLVADADGASIYRIDLKTRERTLVSVAPAVGAEATDYFFISGIDEHEGRILAVGAPVRPITPSSSNPAGPSSLYLIENGEWRLLSVAPEIEGTQTKFRDVVFRDGGGFVAIAGEYFISLDEEGAVDHWVKIAASYGGGILEVADGWLVGAHTKLLKISKDFGSAVQVPLVRRIANIGNVSAAADGQVLITDSDSQAVFLMDLASGEMLRQIGNSDVATKIVAMDVTDDGTVLMLENATPRIFSYAPWSGRAEVVAGNGRQVYSSPRPANEFSFQYPSSVAVGPDGAIYVTEANYRIARIAEDDATIFAGSINSGVPEEGQHRSVAQFGTLRGIDVDDQGRVWVVDAGHSTLWRIETDDTLTRIMGTGEAGGWEEGRQASTQSLRSPYDVLVRRDGTVLVSDTYNSTIVEIGLDGLVRKFAGTKQPLSYQGQGSFGGDGGRAVYAQFNTPRALAEGPDGSVYVMDQFNDRVRRISPDGVITTVAGGGFGVSEDASRLNHATGIAVTDTHLFVADTGNSIVWAVPLE